MSGTRPLLVVQHDPDGGPGRMLPHLGPVDVRRPDLGEPLPDGLAAHRGLVVLGGEMAAWEDDEAPWLPATRALLAAAVRDGVPALGVCLGAQLLALATGGSVSRGSTGTELGLTEVELLPGAAADPVLGRVAAEAGGRFAAPQYHVDGVDRLPADAEHLATGRDFPHQAFRVGAAAWAVQYHPEVTRRDFAAWCRGGRDGLLAEGLDPEAAQARMAAEDDRLDRLAAAHARAFAAAATASVGA